MRFHVERFSILRTAFSHNTIEPGLFAIPMAREFLRTLPGLLPNSEHSIAFLVFDDTGNCRMTE